MKPYQDKFDELYKNKQNLDIYIFAEEPLTIKRARFNQGGEVCKCFSGNDKASQKTKNGWQQVDCNSNCPHRQRGANGKTACNRIAWLKFLLPEVSKDRIFLMRITSQTSINTLDEYFTLQKSQRASIKGYYTIFLSQKEQSNYLCQTFNNYVLDILRKEDFIRRKAKNTRNF